MTVQTTTSRADYTGNGATTAFTVPFYFLDSTHVQVLRTQISTGTITTLALTTDYTVSGAGVPAGGTVTCLVAPTTDQKISILRNVPLTQLVNYVPNDPFPAATHERALDQLTMEVQQVNEVAGRALKLPANTTGASTSLPYPEANKVIAWNETATGLQNINQLTLASIVAAGSMYADQFTGTGAQTAFTLTTNPGSINNLDVSIGGVTQLPGVDYTWVSGTTLTFTSAPPNGVKILVRYVQALPQATAQADSVYYTQAGTGAVTRTAQAKMRDVVSVKDFGADPTGVTSSSSAIIAAQTYLASIGGGTLYFPPGEYKVTTPIEMKPGVTYQGPMKAGLSSYNPGRSRVFSSTGNVFVNSASTITEVCFRDLFIESEAGGGHVFDWSSAGIVAKVEMSGVCLAQRNAAKCVIYGVAAGGVFSIWLHDFEYVYVPACAYPPIWIASTTVNSIVIDRFWSTANGQSAAGNPSIWVESTNPGATAFNVEIRQGVFEFPGSGSVIFKSVTNSVIEDCTTYDLSISPGYHQFAVLKGPSGPASSNVAIKRCRSSVGTVSFADLFLDTSVAGQGNFLVESCTFLYADGVSTTGGATIAVVNSAITNFRNFAYTQFANGATSNVKFGNTLGSSKTYELWNGYSGNGDGYFHIYQNGAYVGAISPSGLLQWGGTRAAPAFYADQVGNLNLKSHLYPGTPAGVDQVNAGLFGGTGAPNNANGNNGDFYFRGDGGAGTSIYMKRAGAWVGIV